MKKLPDIGAEFSKYAELIQNLIENHKWYILIGLGVIIFFALMMLVKGYIFGGIRQIG